MTAGSVRYEGKDLLDLDPEERAREGVFLAFQYPVEIRGITNAYFLRSALNAIRKHKGQEELDPLDFLEVLEEKLKAIGWDDSFMNRAVNEGFSGGEKKRNEILQMAVLEPRLAILDETDSGLDIDALKTVAEAVNKLRAPRRSVVVVTHYQRLLNYIVPDHVHVLADGRIVKSGGKELALRARSKGLRLAQAGGSGDGGVTEHFLGQYRAFAANGAAAAPAWLRGVRERAIARFAEVGFPTTRHEEWRFTNVQPIAETPFTPEPRASRPTRGPRPERRGRDARWFREGVATAVAGPGSRRPVAAWPGATATGWRTGRHAASRRRRAQHRLPLGRTRSFTCLRASWSTSQSNLTCRLPAGAQRAMAHPRLLVVMGRAAQATVVEVYDSASSASY